MGRVGVALGHHLEGVSHPHGQGTAIDDGKGRGGDGSKAGGFDDQGRDQTGCSAHHELKEGQLQGIGFG